MISSEGRKLHLLKKGRQFNRGMGGDSHNLLAKAEGLKRDVQQQRRRPPWTEEGATEQLTHALFIQIPAVFPTPNRDSVHISTLDRKKILEDSCLELLLALLLVVVIFVLLIFVVGVIVVVVVLVHLAGLHKLDHVLHLAGA